MDGPLPMMPAQLGREMAGWKKFSKRQGKHMRRRPGRNVNP